MLVKRLVKAPPSKIIIRHAETFMITNKDDLYMAIAHSLERLNMQSTGYPIRFELIDFMIYKKIAHGHIDDVMRHELIKHWKQRKNLDGEYARAVLQAILQNFGPIIVGGVLIKN